MYEYGHGMNGWGFVLMIIAMVLLTTLITVAVVVIVRTMTTPSWASKGPAPNDTRAEHLLAERFARGEIDDEEYRRRLHILRTGSLPG